MVNLRWLIRQVLLAQKRSTIMGAFSQDKEKHLFSRFQASCMGWFDSAYSLQIQFNQCGNAFLHSSYGSSSLLDICNLFIIKLTRLTRPEK